VRAGPGKELWGEPVLGLGGLSDGSELEARAIGIGLVGVSDD